MNQFTVHSTKMCQITRMILILLERVRCQNSSNFLVVNTENYILNLVKLYQIFIAITLFRLIYPHMQLSLVPNQSENCYYSPNVGLI